MRRRVVGSPAGPSRTTDVAATPWPLTFHIRGKCLQAVRYGASSPGGLGERQAVFPMGQVAGTGEMELLPLSHHHKPVSFPSLPSVEGAPASSPGISESDATFFLNPSPLTSATRNYQHSLCDTCSGASCPAGDPGPLLWVNSQNCLGLHPPPALASLLR